MTNYKYLFFQYFPNKDNNRIKLSREELPFIKETFNALSD